MSEIEFADEPIEMVGAPSLEGIPSFNLEGAGGFEGPPVYIATQDDVQSKVEAHGINSYYVLGIEEYLDDKKVKRKRPAVFKVLKSDSFYYVQPVESAVALEKVVPKWELSLPKMPYELIKKIEQFFRSVFADIGTEATVILTYDFAFRNTENESQGWGVLIPKQQNTSHACKYDPSSIVNQIPNETTNIVGTVHSHPGMAAYASSTDHKDQSNEDGLHITIGWQSSNKNQTEYHIDLAINGAWRNLKPEQVFEERPDIPVDPVIEEWKKEVSKHASQAKPFQGPSAPKSTGSGSTVTSSGIALPQSYYAKTTTSGGPKEKLDPTLYPVDGPVALESNVVIGLTDKDDANIAAVCPFCGIIITSTEHKVTNRCCCCGNYVAPGDFNTLEAMSNLGESSDLRGLGDKPSIDIYVWYKKGDQTTWERLWQGVALEMDEAPKV
jgi:hypothetical protein